VVKDRIVDPVKEENFPSDWTAEKCLIAKDAMQVLLRHYKGWRWGIEFEDDPQTGGIAGLMIRILDIMTETRYFINAKDIDRDRMHCAMIAGGMLLEAHGLSRTKNRHDEVRGLKTTPAGLLVPDHAAMPENNPGYAKIKQQNLTLR
jgi:hypothetical protein